MTVTTEKAIQFFRVKPGRVLHYPRDVTGGRVLVWADTGQIVRIDHPLTRAWLAKQKFKVRELEECPDNERPVQIGEPVIEKAMRTWDQERKPRPEVRDDDPATPRTREATSDNPNVPPIVDPNATTAELQEALRDADALRERLKSTQGELSETKAELLRLKKSLQAQGQITPDEPKAADDGPPAPDAPPPPPPVPEDGDGEAAD